MSQYQSTNLTDCIRYIHRNLGSKLIVPELTVGEISRIITQESLKTYSKFFPHVLRIPMKTTDRLPNKRGFYKIPNLDDLELIKLRVFYANNSYAFSNGVASIPMSLNPIGQQMYSDYLSATTTPITISYWAPDVLEVFPKQGMIRDMVLEVDTVHPDHLRTIGIKMRDNFYKLALLDVLISLQPLRSRFQNLSSEYGTISLVLDKIESAGAEREELLRLFSQESPWTGNKKRIWFG